MTHRKDPEFRFAFMSTNIDRTGFVCDAIITALQLQRAPIDVNIDLHNDQHRHDNCTWCRE